MKSLSRIFAIIITLNFFSLLLPKQVAAQPGVVNYQVFYDELAPFGEWVFHPTFGNVWLPNAGPGFVPYSTNGHWVYTNYGWTWVSDYPWGWAPFHYGRWEFENSFGWFWIPGSEWGPAWVSWRRSNGYYGWAPLGPNITVNGSFGRDYYVPEERWVFVDERFIGSPMLNQYYAPRENYGMIMRNSSVINETYMDNDRGSMYVSGPRRDEVERRSGSRIMPYNIEEHDRPGQVVGENRINMYRPRMQQPSNSNLAPVPNQGRVRNFYEQPGNGRENQQQVPRQQAPAGSGRENVQQVPQQQQQQPVGNGREAQQQAPRQQQQVVPQQPQQAAPQQQQAARQQPAPTAKQSAPAPQNTGRTAPQQKPGLKPKSTPVSVGKTATPANEKAAPTNDKPAEKHN